MFPPLEPFKKVAGAPLSFVWSEDHQPWITDGARTPTVKALEAASLRGGLTLLAVSCEWFMHRLWSAPTAPQAPRPVAWDRLLAHVWSEILRPGTLDLDVLRPDPVGVRSIDEPMMELARTLRDVLRVARDFSGAYFSYNECALRLVDHVMPSTAYRNWRRKAYATLAELSGDATMAVGRRRIDALAAELGIEDYKAEKRIVAAEGLGALWGPVVLREELVTGARLDDAARNIAISRLEAEIARQLGDRLL